MIEYRLIVKDTEKGIETFQSYDDSMASPRELQFFGFINFKIGEAIKEVVGGIEGAILTESSPQDAKKRMDDMENDSRPRF